MIFDTSRLNLVVRVLFLALLASATTWCLLRTSFIILPAILVLLTIIATIHLIVSIEKANRDFTDFLMAIKNSEFSKHNIPNNSGRSTAGLKEAQNVILEAFQKVRLDNEAHYFLLQNVIEHVKTAIIAYNETGEIVLLNGSAKALLQISDLKNIASLKLSQPALYKSLVNTKAGNNPIIELEHNGNILKLLVKASDFSIHQHPNKLISITNIGQEIDHAELLAWEKLIYVLTHEIMNSITPVSSLSSLLKDKARMVSDQHKDNEQIHDIAEGLSVIEKRSNGLVDFVNSYKALTVLPTPQLAPLDLEQLFLRIKMLKQDEFEKKGIYFVLKLQSPAMQLIADQNLLEQVLINLLNNASDACAGRPGAQIAVSAVRNAQCVEIVVQDNGTGISTENLARIFIPFFTTKKNGSGIGLSLSKQILRLHKGNIFVTSDAGKGTTFRISFPADENLTATRPQPNL